MTDSVNDLAIRLQRLYRGRNDVQGTEDGGCLWKRVTIGHWRGHLQGKFCVGIYPLRLDGMCAFVVVDVDRHDIDQVLQLRRLLCDVGLTAHVLTSKSKGYHVAIFVAGWVRAADVLQVVKPLLLEAGLPPQTEIYPRVDYIDSAAKAPGGYIRPAYLAALADDHPKYRPEPGRRVALDLKTLRPLDLSAFLDLAESSRADPDLVRMLAAEMAADGIQEGIRHAVRSSTGTPDTSALAVPISGEVQLARVSPEIETLIRSGWSETTKYRSRSEAQQAVADALVNAGYTDADVRAVLTNPAFGISLRARQQAARRREDAIRRCIEKARATCKRVRPVTSSSIAVERIFQLHALMIERGLPASAWPVLLEIVRTIKADGLSLATSNSIAEHLGGKARNIRNVFKLLREAGIIEAVPLEPVDGQWRRVAHRLKTESTTPLNPSATPHQEPPECEIRSRQLVAAGNDNGWNLNANHRLPKATDDLR